MDQESTGDDADLKRFEEAKRILDAAPPEIVREMILERGLVALALDAIKELAKSDDPIVRQDTRRLISEYQLDLLLIDEDSDDAG